MRQIVGLKLQACMQQCRLLRQLTNYWYRLQRHHKYRPIPDTGIGLTLVSTAVKRLAGKTVLWTHVVT